MARTSLKFKTFPMHCRMVSGGLTFIVVKSDLRHLSEESHVYDCELLTVCKWRNITVASFLQEHEAYSKEVRSVTASGAVFIVNSLGR